MSVKRAWGPIATAVLVVVLIATGCSSSPKQSAVEKAPTTTLSEQARERAAELEREREAELEREREAEADGGRDKVDREELEGGVKSAEEIERERKREEAAAKLPKFNTLVTSVHHDTSPPLKTIRPLADKPGGGEGQENTRGEILPHPGPATKADTALQTKAPTRAAPTVLSGWDGVGNGFTGPGGTFTVNSAPPDTSSAVGPTQVVEIVNSGFAVWNKATGVATYGPAATNTLFSGFGGGCQTNNDGDGVVRYDRAANRWIITQFSVSTTPFLECTAVSQTSDATGAWNRYSFQYAGFPDYPKLSVWPDAYYITFNMFNAAGTAYLGATACAMDRTKMLAGLAATQQCFSTSSSYGGLLPTDLDSALPPPSGEPNLMVSLGVTNTTLAYWKFHVDWATPANSTFTGPTAMTVAAYTTACGASGTCIPQSGGGSLDSLSDRLMFRSAYRNFGDHEATVFSHAITVGSSVGVRWYELRLNSAGTPTLFQQGTYAPDASYRWMSSAAFDKAGDIGMGYSVSSSALKPSIRATGRLAGDAAGTMTQGEATLVAGLGAQGSSLTRWGDYSSMSIDPSDDCTFWFASEYIPANGTFNWRTRNSSFQLPGCTSFVGNNFSVGASPGTGSVTAGSGTSSTISTSVVSGAAEAVGLTVSGMPAGVTATLSPTTVTAGLASTLTITTTGATVPGTYPLTITGTAPSATHTTGYSLTVTAAPTAPGAPTIGAVTGGNAQATVNWTAPASDGGSAITGYVVTPYIGASAQAAQTFNSTATSQVVTGLTNGSTYTFKVAAKNAIGTGPDSAASASALVATTPGAPTIGAVTGGDAQATVNWTAPASDGGSAITGYVVTPYLGASAQAAQTFNSTATSQVVTGLTNGSTYTFKVAAKNAVGTGPDSAASASALVATTPGAPSIIGVGAADSKVALSWSPPASDGGSPVTGYVVTPSIAGTPQTPQTFNTTATIQVVTGLVNGTSYTFTVAAKNAVGTGPDSAPSDAVAPIALVLHPGIGSVAEGDTGSVTVDVPITLSAASATAVTVHWTTLDSGAAGIATAGADYTAASGDVTFAPGETAKTVSVTVLGDTIDEPPLLYGEWILVSFSAASGATIDPSFFGLGVGVIADDDPTPIIKPGTGIVLEGNVGDVVVNVPVTLSNPSAGTVTVDYHTADTGAAGVATAGVDYVAKSGTVTFAPGETTKTVAITVHGDTVREPPLLYGEWILVAFNHPSANATLDTSFFGVGLGIIQDDDAASVLRLAGAR